MEHCLSEAGDFRRTLLAWDNWIIFFLERNVNLMTYENSQMKLEKLFLTCDSIYLNWEKQHLILACL